MLHYTTLFYPNEYKKNDKIILKYFQQDLNKLKRGKSTAMFAINVDKIKTLKYHTLSH